MSSTKFAAFILTHGRADRVITNVSLRRSGYTGEIFYIVDNEDKQVEAYRQKFGDSVIVFDKLAASKRMDSGNNFGKRNSILFARNESFEIAKQLGLDYFIQLDDDYPSFNYAADSQGNYLSMRDATRIRSLDKVFASCVRFLHKTSVSCVAFAQGGDFIGGENGSFAKVNQAKQWSRKAMNSFICSTRKPFQFRAIYNEDVNTYVDEGRRGRVFLTIPRLRLNQKPTQSQPGGITELYLDCGTYIKAFTTVMYQPSCVKVIWMGSVNRRIHHAIRWKNAVPQIVSESLRK
jgi:hypothetical protein